MTAQTPVLWWVRRDLRLSDNPALLAALDSGAPLVPVFVLDEGSDALGAAPKWRLAQGLAALSAALEARGSKLILRRGAALGSLQEVLRETGAHAVHWNRQLDPQAIARDRAVMAVLRTEGIAAHSHNAALLCEPWQLTNAQGVPYRVYTPFWRALRGRDLAPPLPDAPAELPAPLRWPGGESLCDWRLGALMGRGAEVVAKHAQIGEAAASARLGHFMAERIGAYKRDRDFLALDATSGLSENLAWGEIGPRAIWQAGMAALQQGAAAAEQFLKQLGWREFGWHLLYHTPHIADRNWRSEWDGFPWRGDNDDAEAWRRGRTGEPLVDAAMREMYVTGTMHNRARMIAASYLTKHLMTDWRIGADRFAQCLIDWDPAANALGWQWVAGSGPDAAPFFRIFNPVLQAEKFDPDAAYRRGYLAEWAGAQAGTAARDYFDAVPRSWRLSADLPYPEPRVDLAEGRARALAAFNAIAGAQR